MYIVCVMFVRHLEPLVGALQMPIIIIGLVYVHGIEYCYKGGYIMVYSGYLLLLVNLCNKAQSAQTTIRLDPTNSHHQDNLLLIRTGTD